MTKMIPKSEQDVLDSFSFKIPELIVNEKKRDNEYDLNYDGDFIDIGNSVGYTVKDNHIIELKIIGQKLEFLPENIGNLNALENLILIENNLQFLPESIKNLVALKKLDLFCNKLLFLPENIGNLSVRKSYCR